MHTLVSTQVRNIQKVLHNFWIPKPCGALSGLSG